MKLRALFCAITMIPAVTLLGPRTNLMVMGDPSQYGSTSLILYESTGLQIKTRRYSLPPRGKLFRLLLPADTYMIYGETEAGTAACGTSMKIPVPYQGVSWGSLSLTHPED